MDIISLAIIVPIGFFGGMITTLVGGYALFIVPVLIFLGLGAHEAIGTLKFVSVGMAVVGWVGFHKKKLIDYKIGKLMVFPAIAGSITGTYILLNIDALMLKKIIAVATVLFLFVIMLKKDAGVVNLKSKLSNIDWIVGALLVFAIGVYGGFYGGGFATLLSYLLIIFFGQTFLESAATRKIPGFFIVLIPAILLGLDGKIEYSVGIPLLIASMAGTYVGTHYSTKIGNLWVKRMFFVVVLVMSLKLLF